MFRNNNERGKEKGGRRGRGDKDRGGSSAYAADMHLNDGELREIVFELIRCVRTDHIGLSNELLVAAVRRGLVRSDIFTTNKNHDSLHNITNHS